MLYAVQGNKQLQIDESEKTAYLNMGYDIAVEEGDSLNVIAVAPSKTVPYAEYKKLLEENTSLKEQLSNNETAELRKKIGAQAKEIKELENKLKAAEKAAEKAFDPIIEDASKK